MRLWLLEILIFNSMTDNTIENINCRTCPFTCKGAEICEPQQIKNRLRLLLPDVLGKNNGDTMPNLVKPNVGIYVEICGKQYYI